MPSRTPPHVTRSHSTLPAGNRADTPPVPAPPPTVNPPSGLRLIAAFEAAKGFLVLVAGSGVLLLLHANVQALAQRLVAHLHLNPANRIPLVFLHLAAESTSTRLRWLAMGALTYALLRLWEAVGLWTGRRWAEMMGVLSGLVYIPFELRLLYRHPGFEPLIAVSVNVVVVWYLWVRLRPDGEPADRHGGWCRWGPGARRSRAHASMRRTTTR